MYILRPSSDARPAQAVRPPCLPERERPEERPGKARLRLAKGGASMALAGRSPSRALAAAFATAASVSPITLRQTKDQIHDARAWLRVSQSSPSPLLPLGLRAPREKLSAHYAPITASNVTNYYNSEVKRRSTRGDAAQGIRQRQADASDAKRDGRIPRTGPERSITGVSTLFQLLE